MPVDSKTIKALGGPKKVAAAMDMTPSGLWRLTKPGAEVDPLRQRQLIVLARRAGVPLDLADFHRGLQPSIFEPAVGRRDIPPKSAKNQTPATCARGAAKQTPKKGRPHAKTKKSGGVK